MSNQNQFPISLLDTNTAHSLMETTISAIPKERHAFQLARYSDWKTLCEETSVYEVPDLGNNLTKNVLTLSCPSDAEVIEQVMSVQGYLIEVNLPPITKKDQLPPPHWQRKNSAEQHIVLAAPNSLSFNQSVEAFAKVSSYLSTACPTGTLEQWSPKMIDGYPTLRLSSRYLSFPDEGEVLDIPKNIDPSGLLKRLIDTKRQYTTDNVVRYFERGTNDDGSRNYIDINPHRIRAGQLVEVQIRFETRSTNPNHTWFTGRLCTICILDNKYELEALALTMAKPISIQVKKRKTLKRKVGYSGDEVAANPPKKGRITDSTEPMVEDHDREENQ